MEFGTACAGLAAGGALLGAGFFARSEYEKRCLETDRYVIHSPKIRGEGKTFVFLTDLHDMEFGERNRRLLAAVDREKPDAVLCGGDTIVAKGRGDLSVSLALLGDLARKYPVFCGNGNHENRLKRERGVYGDKYREYKAALERMGIVYLENGSAPFGGDFMIYGLDLPRESYLPFHAVLPPGYIGKALGKEESGRFSILLAHSPMFFCEYASWGADLSLCGHFHGGTIRLPVLGGVMTPQYQFFCRWCAGFFRAGKEFPAMQRGPERERRMIAGRGLGTHSIRIRFNDKPQVVVVRVEK